MSADSCGPRRRCRRIRKVPAFSRKHPQKSANHIVDEEKAVVEHKEVHPRSTTSCLLIVFFVQFKLWCRYRPV